MLQLECKDIVLGYEGNIIIEDLNFAVHAGDFLCIIGENGSGKSSLMRTILGLQEPLGGKINFGDGLKQNEIGYLPQQTMVQKDFPATVWEIVLSGCQGRCGIKPFYSREDKILASENIDEMGISHLKNKCYRELSGGQQQRVLLARALCATKKILLLDEPTAGLDPIVTAEMYELIKKLNDAGITIIMISHDIDAVIEYASHILKIGNTVFYGTRKEYMESDTSIFYLKGGAK